ncbi:MAG TPA: sigma-70 family RNA polymerase sigma factor [Frateuria sp.]|uniref:sigma-70 family RNA polymerase sigma factor n=1 Tax=Frateuria sp. TaxID=2211372 RepID=UPI002DEE3438|nr:sigma-70 family RNA polymerase sigma factor [Frateuria sp.]
MKPESTGGTCSPFEAIRIVSTSKLPANDGHDWSTEMVAVAQRRDRASFMRIYDHFMPRVCLYLRGMGSTTAIAEELAQETLLRLWQRAASYDPSLSRVSTWLFRIARNLHIDRVRKEAGWMLVQDALEAEEADHDGRAASSAEAYVEHIRIKACIDRLPATQARLVRMSYFEAKSHHEIAQELDMPLGTVKSGLRRAFLKLQADVRGAA